ncbi:low temperature requirement protein A [Micromonospora sp. NPDC023966]|uniref:low temperature requirement protein A n=1 Tax=Micromonospora sp. NPDC023966 TaxID=3154699 RepID=UPI0033EBAAB4
MPLILGAVDGGTAQIVLWTLAFVVDYGGGRIVTAASLGEVRSAAHFAERHNLVLIIALGESLLSVGASTGAAVTRTPVLATALLGFAATVCLWWLYFQRTAPAVGRALAAAPRHTRRQQLASDSYTLAHLPLIAGISYFALGIHLVLAELTGDDRPVSLGWIPTSVLYGGAALYLAGRLLFGWPAAGTPPEQIAAVGLVLLLVPVARALPALVAFGLLTAVLIALVGYERLTYRDRSPLGPQPD